MPEVTMSQASATVSPGTGYYGKVPVRGDFVTRNLPLAFVNPWHEWVEAGLARSRDLLGQQWTESYQVAPTWRFFLAPGICGPQPIAGTFLPSVDRVGRCFPFVIAGVLPEDAVGARIAVGAGRWFDAIEELGLAALNPKLALGKLDEGLAALGACTANCGGSSVPTDPEPEDVLGLEPAGWIIARRPDRNPVEAFLHLAEEALAEMCPSYCLWWTSGSEEFDAGMLLSPALPSAIGFTAFLDADWARWGWRTRGRLDHGGPRSDLWPKVRRPPSEPR